MDLHAIAGHLVELASYPAERQIAGKLWDIITDESLPTTRRHAHFRGELASQGLAVLSLPWGRQLAVEVAQFVYQLTPGRSLPDLILGHLVNGNGTAASSPAFGRRMWVPAWLASETAARRDGGTFTVTQERWVIPSGWPVPTRQVLVEGFTDDGLLEQAHQVLDLRPASPAEGPGYSQAWLYRSSDEPQIFLREDLMALASIDPVRAMRQFLTGMGNPLIAVASELAIAALRLHAERMAKQNRWNGIYPSSGTQLINLQGQALMTPGWLLQAIIQLGFRCIGMTPAETKPVEEWLVRTFGGSLAESDGQTFCVLPPTASRVILDLKIDWSGIHTV